MGYEVRTHKAKDSIQCSTYQSINYGHALICIYKVLVALKGVEVALNNAGGSSQSFPIKFLYIYFGVIFGLNEI